MKTIITTFLLFFICTFSSAQIFGDNDVCAGYTYSYNASIPGAVMYAWSFPPGWYNVTGQGTGSVTATCNVNSGDIYCEGIDAGGNSVATLVLVTQFGGGAAVGWDVQPQNSGGCAGMQYTLNIVPNGSGGGSCPNGCGNGVPIMNVGYAVYDNVWPVGNFVGFADGSFLSYPPSPGTYSYYIYYVDYTAGTATTQAIRIESNCGSATVNNTAQLNILTPILPWFNQMPDPVCIGDTVNIWEVSGSTNGSYSPVMGITILNQSGSSMNAVVNSMPARANYVGIDWNGCVTSETCYINVCGPSTLAGDTVVCAGTIYSYTATIAGAVTYDWILPSGWYDISGQGSATITATCNANAGWLTVSGLDAGGNIIGVANVLTSFGGGGAAGWDVSPASVFSCITNPTPFSLQIVANGTGGGGGCPAGCGSGTLHSNIVYAVYSNVWPTGTFVQYADGISPIVPPGFNTTYYVYRVDVTDGLNPPQAILISGGCGGGTVNNSVPLFVVWPTPPNLSSYPNPACIGDTITVDAGTGLINPWWNVSTGGILLNNNFNSVNVIVTGNPCEIYIEGIDPNSFCFTATVYNAPVTNCNSGTITGDSVVCAGYTYNYTASIPAAVTYTWTFPSGWYGITGQGTANVSATCNFSDGNVCVEGFDGGGNSLGTECILTQFGGGGFTGWDVQPAAVNGCNGTPFSLSVVPNGTGGGPGCPAGCGSGSLHPNIVYGIYDGVWPNGYYFGNADGFTTFILGGPGSPAGTVYIYLVDITNGVNPPQAVRIQGGCGGGVVNNTCNIAPFVPNPPAVSQIPMPACIGDTVQLFEVTGLTNVGWGFIGGNDLSFISGQFSNPLIAVVTGNNPYTDVTGIDANGCLTYLPLVGVSLGTCALPLVSFASSDTVFCDKQSIDFTDLSTNNPTSWQWSFPGAAPATSTDQHPQGVYYATSGAFDVTLIACNAAGCDTLTLTNFIVEYLAPVDSIFELNDTLFSFPASTYQWYEVGLGLIAGATNQYYVPLQNGNYYCSITDSIGCSGISNTIAITTGIQNIAGSWQLAIVPNPNDGNFEFELISNSKIKNLKTQIINVLGETVFENNFENVTGKFTQQMNLSSQPKGIYILKMIADEKVLKHKIIIN